VSPTGTATLPGPSSLSASGGLPVIAHPLKSGGQAPEMIAVPAGCFMMGSPPDEPGRDTDEGPQHRVWVGAFAIGRTEVTFAQYDRFAERTGRRTPEDRGWGRGDRPVIDVSWDDAVAYTEWLSSETGHSYRLPTEAEWEYAARAGTTGPFWTGDCIHTDQANYDGRYDYADCAAKPGLYRGQTVPTGSLPPNPWGLHEVAGNVWEWCLDGYREDFYAQCQARGQVTDPLAPAAGGSPRVLRGGSFVLQAGFLRASVRFRVEPVSRGRNGGFRCVFGRAPPAVPIDPLILFPFLLLNGPRSGPFAIYND
jgi:formylglycine-generating enzyme required for sulfatase activity